MPTINQNATASIALTAGQWLDVKGTGVAVPQIGPTKGQPQTITNFGKVGPFDFAQTVGLTATGSALTYNIIEEWPDARVDVDATGNPTGQIVTPGGDMVGTWAAYPGQVLGVLGDSISARWLNSSDSTNVYSQPWGFIKWALELSGCFLNPVTAAKPSTGMTAATAGVLPTFQSQRDTLITAGVTHCTFMGGVNDILSNATLAQLQDAATAIIDSLVAAGIKVYWCTIPPISSGYGSYTTARQSVLLAYNDWIRQQAARYGKRVRLVDLYAAVVDPASKTSSFLANATFDLLHPRNWGAYYMGKALAAAWVSDGVPKLPLLLAAAGDAQVDEAGAALFSGSTNILQNGLFNLGTPSSGVAQNWSVTNNSGASSTTSVVAAPGGIGNAQRLDCTFSASGQSVSLASANFASRVNMSGGLLVSLRVDVASPVALKNLRIRTQGFGNVNATYVWSLQDTNDIALPEGWTGLVSFIHVMPPGLTALGGGFVFSVSAESSGAGSVTVDVSQVSVRAVPV